MPIPTKTDGAMLSIGLVAGKLVQQWAALCVVVAGFALVVGSLITILTFDISYYFRCIACVDF